MRRHPTVSVAVAAIGCLTLATVVAPTAASAAPGPSFDFQDATPWSVGDTGGNVALSVEVTDATSCTFSANRSVPGLPATVPCTNGTVVHNVTVPADKKSKAVVYKFKIAVARSKMKSRTMSVTVVGKPNCSERTNRADLAGCNLSGATLGGLSNSDLAGANLTDANLTGADLSGAVVTSSTNSRA
jgi:Pentapeptide repeats (8 copies)